MVPRAEGRQPEGVWDTIGVTDLDESHLEINE